MNEEVLYFERYIYRGWLFAAALALAVSGLAMLLPVLEENLSLTNGIVGLVNLVVGVVAVNFFSAALWVYPSQVRVEFGKALHFAGKRIALNRIQEVRVLDSVPHETQAGWGIRTAEIDGRRAAVLATGSKGAVCLEGDNERFVIGSAFPGRLSSVIAERLQYVEKPPPPKDDSDDDL